MARISEKKILAIVIGGSVMLTGLCGAGAWWTYSVEDELRVRMEETGKKMTEAKAKISRIPKDEKEVVILRENVKEYVKILPDKKELENFTRTLNQFALQTGVDLKSMTPGKETSGTGAFERVTYRLTLSASLWQFLRFMNCIESYNRFMNVTTFQLSAGQPANNNANNPLLANKQVLADMIHSIGMDVETYTYNAASGEAAQVRIPGYEKKRAQLREEILRRKADVSIEKYPFKDSRSRRDIFVDPRINRDDILGSNKVGLPLNEQNALIDRAKAEITLLEEKQKGAEGESNFIRRFELHKAVKEGLTKIEAKIAEVNEKELVTYRPYKLRFQVEVVQRCDALKKKLESGKEESGDGMTVQELVTIRKRMEDHLEAGELDSAVEHYELAREKIVAPEGDPRQEIEQQIRRLYQKARVGQEFSRKDIRIIGAVVVPGGISGAIINGDIYQEGDAVEDDLFVKSIGRESIEFLFRGVIIAKRM